MQMNGLEVAQLWLDQPTAGVHERNVQSFARDVTRHLHTACSYDHSGLERLEPPEDEMSFKHT